MTTYIPAGHLNRCWLSSKPTTVLRHRQRCASYDLYPWQQRAYKKLHDELLVWLNVPMGAGKSTAIMATQISYLIANPIRKVIIAVPKTAIADNYVQGDLFRLPGGSTIDLRGMVGANMCDDDGLDGSKTAALLDFLRSKPAAVTLNPVDVRDRLFLCSHALLSLAYDQVRGTPEAKTLFKGVTVVIDEAHHVLNNETEEEGGAREFVRNRLGELAHFLVSEVSQAGLWLVTATAFRGDGLSMMPADDRTKFVQFNMTFEEYWREMLVDIKSYRYDFATYKMGQSDEVFRHLVKTLGKSKLLVFCGNSLHSTSGGCKYEGVKRLMEIVKDEWGSDLEVLDLVTDDHARETRKRQLKDKACRPDVVFALRIMDEGMDWPEAQNAIDLAPLRSLPVVYQRFGRLTRNAKGKPHLRYITMLPVPMGGEDRETQIQMYNENLACLMGAMMLEDLGQPMRFGEKRAHGKGGRSAVNWLTVALPDANQLRDVWLKGWNAVMEQDEILTKESALDVLKEILAEAGVEQHLDETATALFNRCRYVMWRGNRARRGLGGATAKEIVKAGLTPFNCKEEMEGGRWYTSEMCGLKSFEEWKKAREDADDRTWMEKFEEWKRDKHPSYRSPLHYWVGNQRQYKQKGQLSACREELLTKEHFEWDPFGSCWNNRFEQWKRNKTPSRNSALACWAQAQRSRKKKGLLSLLRMQALDNNGFVWDPIGESFDRFINELSAYKQKYGNMEIPHNFVTAGGYKLGSTCNDTRKRYKKKRLPPKRHAKLQALGFRFDVLPSSISEDPRQARELVIPLQIQGQKHYYKLHRKGVLPPQVPASPVEYYKNHPHWICWRWFLGGRPWTFKSPQGDLFETYNLSALARDTGLDVGGLSQISLGRRSQHKGWTFVSGPKD